MSEEKTDNPIATTFSSYGLITAERLLQKYHIHLPQNDLAAAIKHPNSFFYRILKVPVKNILNGIILNQAKDYYLYAQKLFIDYLLSGESGKQEDAPGGQTHENLEDTRKELVKLGERFHQQELEHSQLISESQLNLIAFTEKWRKSLQTAIKEITSILPKQDKTSSTTEIEQALLWTLAHAKGEMDFPTKLAEKLSLEPLDQTLSETVNACATLSSSEENELQEFYNKAEVMAENLRAFRTQFYEMILQINLLLSQQSDYRPNVEQLKINKEALDFDKEIG